MDYRSRIISVITEWEDECAALEKQARESGSKLELANAGLLAMIAKKDSRIADLEIEHKRLLDEYQSFMSVSRVVMISNENAKLRDRVALLERCSRNKVPLAASLPDPKEDAAPPADAPVELAPDVDAKEEDAPTLPEDAPTPPVEAAPVELAPDIDAKEEAAPTPTVELAPDIDAKEEADINVYEKKIKGVVYYIDEADNIYEQLEDGVMGDILGRYVTDANNNNKRKIEWM